MNDGGALVTGRGVTRVFGTGPAAVGAIREATFEVMPGDRIALVGPSGSGKSTLLHLMAALDRPTAGAIEWPALHHNEMVGELRAQRNRCRPPRPPIATRLHAKL